MASGTLSSNTSGDWVNLPYGKGMLILSGTFGSGTAQLEVKDSGGTARSVTDGAWTAAVVTVVDLESPVDVRITLAGATTPTLRWELREQLAA